MTSATRIYERRDAIGKIRADNRTPCPAYVKDYIKGLSELGVTVEDLSKYDTDLNLLKFWYFLRVVVNPSDQLALQNILENQVGKMAPVVSTATQKLNWGMYEGNLRGMPAKTSQRHRNTCW